MNATIMLALAVGLDLLLGDPAVWPHPVRAIGWCYDRLDAFADRMGWRSRLFGTVGVCAVAGGSAVLVWAASLLPVLGPLCALYFAYAGLALGSLLAEARRAARFLMAGDLDAARTVVGGLVSRETAELDASQLWRALAESVAENANDGFVAPLFWLALTGPAGLWAYKAVSTADSMWGYRTPRHEALGWFGARADDVLAFVPARLTVAGLWLAARLLGQGRGVTLTAIVRDARKSASPNAGWPMAAAAWLCGGGMGGPSRYFGRIVEKPRFGPAGGQWDAGRLRLLSRMVLLTGCIVAVGTIVLRIVFTFCNVA
ncbi:cobalamin biosynthesis protein CobD [Desulfovibrio aerotolerans]|uniref:Cobalamin biosynthesis protein CobD n=1 Tax=Solidesulfovibrio aerotolerans TaxID=295255 RepID=A0A7C9MN70_9BACT|nr:adenosylcobinamide-phosphate synthase CbiB [Solidesulfovibrio aerotolerans]MYL85133.1 cobalamin biosynthesis protein CobD [Solidesulfovibrio aerotolerans]